MSNESGPSPAPVTRVLRASLSRVNGSVMEELFAARERACGPNRVEGLCGALLYSSGWFVLWLEGPEQAVQSVIRRSAGHRCHAEPRIIHRSVGARTLSEPLILATTQGPEANDDFARRIESVAQARPTLEPAQMWRMLSQPCTLADSSPTADALPRRIALVASDDNHSIDIVRKLADRFRRPMVYQRFATADLQTRDVGAAYVDIAPAGRPTRVQVLSRRALGHRMVRESLRGVHSLALLLGARPATAIDLAANVAGFVDSASPEAEIDLVGECPVVARTVGDYLRSRLRAPESSKIQQVPHGGLIDFLLGESQGAAAAPV